MPSVKFGPFILRKIIKFVATRCYLWRLPMLTMICTSSVYTISAPLMRVTATVLSDDDSDAGIENVNSEMCTESY